MKRNIFASVLRRWMNLELINKVKSEREKQISYMKRVASLGLMHDTGCLGLVHWNDPEGWYGEGGVRRKIGRAHV